MEPGSKEAIREVVLRWADEFIKDSGYTELLVDNNSIPTMRRYIADDGTHGFITYMDEDTLVLVSDKHYTNFRNFGFQHKASLKLVLAKLG